jgi:hypothetical protein
VSGTYEPHAVSDGLPAYRRQGLVEGKQYHLHRHSWTDDNAVPHTAWFISTTTNGSPPAAEPFWQLQAPAATGEFLPQEGGSGAARIEPAAPADAGGTQPAGEIVGIAVHEASVEASQSIQLVADVTARGIVETGLAWSVDLGSLGSVDPATGVYTAPAIPGTYRVSATSAADVTKYAAGTVVVTSPVTAPPDAPPGTPPPPPPATPPACSYGYSEWSACQPTDTQSRTVLSADPSGCTGTPVVVQACTYVPPAVPACTYAYSAWGACQPGNTQTRTVVSSAPAGCQGTPVLTQACNYVAPPTTPPPAGARVYPPAVPMVKYAQPSVARPAPGASVTNVFSPTDPTQNTVTTRASDRLHHYPKSAVWNIDESLMLVSPTPGVYTAYPRFVIDGTTYADVRDLSTPLSGVEHRLWSNTNPRYLYGVTSAAKQWVRVDAVSATATVLKTYAASDFDGLTSLNAISFGSFEAEIDNADTGAVILGTAGAYNSDGMTKATLINPGNGAVRCKVTGGPHYGQAILDAAMSQDGNYFSLFFGGPNYAIDAYRASDCTFQRTLTTSTGHYDNCVTPAGDQVAVVISWPNVMAYRFSDGQATVVYSEPGKSTGAGHVSCRNVKRPGYAYVSAAYGPGTDSTFASMAIFHRIFAVRLDGSQRVENYGWDHVMYPTQVDAGYPYATPSPNGDRVRFNSQWDANGAASSYVAQKR